MATVIPDLLRECATAEPHRTALMLDGRESLSYGQWEARSDAVARGLVGLGVEPGDRIGLFFENAEWLDFAVAYFGVLQAGSVAVPLSSRFTGPDLRSVLDDCRVEGIVAGAHRPKAPGWHTTVDELEAAAGTGTAPVPGPVRRAADDLAEILYTSGTTGSPKGVACRHLHVVRPLVEPGDWPPEWWAATTGGVYLHANAVSTAAGQLRLLEPLGPQRMTTLALAVFDPVRFCQLAEEHRAAVVQLVPAMARSILESDAHRRHDLSGVRVVSLGCAPLPADMVPKLAAAFPRARLVNMYELSEARYAGTTQVYDGSESRSVGLPRGATEVVVADEAGRPLPPGVVGEVRLRWRGLPAQQYFEDSEATARVFVNGWTRTGDVGYLDEAGRLYLVDRLKDVIIKGGINIGSPEVEDALREHPAITDCAVFGIPDKIYGEDVAAAVVLRQPISAYDLRRFLQTRLAPHKIPQRFLRLGELPRNRSGKVVKRELQARFLADAS